MQASLAAQLSPEPGMTHGLTQQRPSYVGTVASEKLKTKLKHVGLGLCDIYERVSVVYSAMAEEMVQYRRRRRKWYLRRKLILRLDSWKEWRKWKFNCNYRVSEAGDALSFK